jgi:Fanconi anemia group M protein
MTDSTPPAPLAADTPNFHKFDSEKLCTWVYPTNYPIRTYQLNMVEKALFQNTLIALPTGLGKTFIGAVVMLNYWRWFPESKVVFLAPTRPLVSQQLEACFNICGIPQSETIEMTGQMAVSKRRQHWSTKRVFFMTPETMQNDLVSRICPAERIACLVIDEAHRATGNYAFVEVVRSIANSHPHFRVLALTATPGSNLDNVQTVVNNLHLNTIQIKTEQDLEQFLHNKIIERKVIDERPELWFNTVETFQTSIFQPLLVELASSNVISTNDPKGNKPYYLMKARHFFQDNALDVSARKRIHLINTFEICEALSRANELLETHGIGAFVESLDHATNVAIRNNRELQQLIQSLKDKMTDPGFESHPKMEQLIKVLLKHFGDADDVSKVLIFSNYRSSVSDICKKINTFPWVRAAEFVGTTNGLTKAQQQQVRIKDALGFFSILLISLI